MLVIVLSQPMQVEEEVKATRTRFYTVDGYLGFWASDNQFYRSEIGFQLQHDLGVYGRFSVISFNKYRGFTVPSVKEAFVEFAFGNSLDIKGGIGPLFWENGLVLGDYIGGNPFVEVSYGRTLWFDLLVSNTINHLFGGLRVALDMSGNGMTAYGIYDSSKVAYGGLSVYSDMDPFSLKLEGVGTNKKEGAVYLSTNLNLGRISIGLHGFSATDKYNRIVAQGLRFDDERSPFMGFSTYLTYNYDTIPWTDISNRSGEFIRIAFMWPLNEDWKLKPSFDFGMYQSAPMDVAKRNSYFVDGHLRFDWTESIYMGLSAGAMIDSTFNWRAAIYIVNIFGF